MPGVTDALRLGVLVFVFSGAAGAAPGGEDASEGTSARVLQLRSTRAGPQPVLLAARKQEPDRQEPEEEEEPSPGAYPTSSTSGGSRRSSFEEGTNRSGRDFQDFTLYQREPSACESACVRNSECRAWTYVKPGVQGQEAHCWLKRSAAPPERNDCCTSGFILDAGSTQEAGDRPGGDYRGFSLDRGDPALCRTACIDDGRCGSWTYVKPAVQGSSARCYLKGGIPGHRANACCTSGVKHTLETGFDRPGGDYLGYDVSSDPAVCQSACLADSRCQSWTYVKPGVQGAAARCHLKDSKPGARSNACCTSGVRGRP